MNDKVLSQPNVRDAWRVFKSSGYTVAYLFFRETYDHEYQNMLKKGEL